MPKIEVEILRTVTITREENVTLELNVPKTVIDDGGELDWVDQVMEKQLHDMTPTEKAAHRALTAAEWDIADEDHSVQYDEANNLSD